MNISQLHEALAKLDFQQRFLLREIVVLKRKKVTKRDPYDVLRTVLLYLYCVKDTDRFLQLFQQFIEAEIDGHFAQTHDLWFSVSTGTLPTAFSGSGGTLPSPRRRIRCRLEACFG